MKNVPKMISTKDLSYLEDMFNWHITACKKTYNHSKEVEDKEISKHLEKVSKEHKKICNTILSIIESEK